MRILNRMDSCWELHLDTYSTDGRSRHGFFVKGSPASKTSWSTRSHPIDILFPKTLGNPSPKTFKGVNNLGIIDKVLAWINIGLKNRKLGRHKYLSLKVEGGFPFYSFLWRVKSRTEHRTIAGSMVEVQREKTSKLHFVCVLQFAYPLFTFHLLFRTSCSIRKVVIAVTESKGNL